MKKKHTIHKVFIELNTKSKTQAYEIKDNISSFLSSEVFPSLEEQLNTLDSKSASYAVQIDKLTLNISESSISLNNGLKEGIISNFKEALEVIEQGDDMKSEPLKKQLKTLNKEDHYLNTFTYFLKNGTTPWWNTNESISFLFTPKILNEIIATPTFSKQFLTIIPNAEVLERFINQFTDTDIHKICTKIAKQHKTTVNLSPEILHKITSLNALERKVIWMFIVRTLVTQRAIDNTLINDIFSKQMLKILLKEEFTITSSEKGISNKNNAIHETRALDKKNSSSVSKDNSKKHSSKLVTDTNRTQSDLKKVLKSITKKNKYTIDSPEDNSTYNDPEGHHINNAGLVLAHPFLKHFFTHCKLLDKNNELINPELCAHLLHYIATGKTQQAESDMVFEKFLCNIPLTQSINRHVIITDEHINQANQLLNAINDNWPAMKKSTTALLQHEFLQRPGKMVFKNENTTITVEHKTQDILFNSLSWGIGLIKLPWKKDFMYANW